MRRIVIIILLCLIFPVKNVAALQMTPEIESPSAILVEKTTGKVLYEKNADEKMRPASVTKVMTILLIMEEIEDGNLGYHDIVVASAYATSMGGSQVYLKEGEKMTVDEMLKCIVVASANDACVAMAEHISGSVEAFITKMNERAVQLGMTNTNFVNCTGLEAEGHLTTARDISIMSMELLKHDDVKKYTKIWMDTIRDGQFGLTNTNKLIRFYDKATGLKTGYTKESMYCISATAEQDGMELIAVVMAAPSSDQRNADAKTLLNYGFANYSLYSPKIDKLEPVKVLKGKNDRVEVGFRGNINLVIEKGTESNHKFEITLANDVLAPVDNGQKLGEARLIDDGVTVAQADIISIHAVEKSGILDIFLDLLRHFLLL